METGDSVFLPVSSFRKTEHRELMKELRHLNDVRPFKI